MKKQLGEPMSLEQESAALQDIETVVIAINAAGVGATEAEIMRGIKWLRATRADAACLSLVEKGKLSARFPAKGDITFALPLSQPARDGKPPRKGMKR